MTGRTDKFVREVKEVLEWDILKFWSGMQDPRGGFYGRISEDGTAEKDAIREEQLNARILWAFSIAYRQLRKKEYLMPAISAKEFFVQHFLDHKFGGAYTAVDAWGERMNSDASLGNQALAIYSLSEFYSATKDDEALKCAVNLFRIVEKEFLDADNGGYVESLVRDFSPKDDSKVAESHLYLLEGYANLYRIWRDEGLRDRLAALLDLFAAKFFNPATGHLVTRFSRNWSDPVPGCRYGTDLEASWAMLDAAYAVQDIDIVDKVKGLCGHLCRAGMEGMTPDGHLSTSDTDPGMEPWAQAEALIGNLCAWKYLCDAEGANRALAIWDFIKAHQSAEGNRNAYRRYPMHGARACIQVLNLFR